MKTAQRQAKPRDVRYGGLVQNLELSRFPPGAESQSDAWPFKRRLENRSGVPDLPNETVSLGLGGI